MTAVAVEPTSETLEAHEFTPPCEAITVLTVGGKVFGEEPDPCGHPARVVATIHDWHDHTYRTKFLCLECLANVSPLCYAGCGQPNITSLQSI